MMQKASDPRYVRSAFQAIGVPLDAATVMQQHDAEQRDAERPTTSRNAVSGPESAPAPFWSLACEDLIPRLLDDWTDEQIVSLGGVWFASDDAKTEAGGQQLRDAFSDSAELLESLRERFLGQAGSEGTIETTAAENWQAQLVRFSAQWALLAGRLGDRAAANAIARNPGDGATDPEFARVLDDYLDRRLIAATTDAATWKASERVAFWRWLQAGSRERPSDARQPVEVSTLQLESGTSGLKGQAVRFRGSVRRVEEQTRMNVLSGSPDRYWILWLRGLDEANQPVAVYTRNPLAQRISVRPAESDSSTDVEVSAVVGKRLAYVSESGVQVAPTLFADEIEILQQAVAAPIIGDDAVLSEFALAATVGCLAGGLIAIPLLFAGLRKRARRNPATRNIAGLTILLLACAEFGSGHNTFAAAPQSSPAASKPPWAEQLTEDPVHAILRDRLAQYLTPQLVQELRATLGGAPGAFPDDVLKTMRLCSQLGWDRIVQSRPFEYTNSGASARIEQFEGLARSARAIQLSEEQIAWFNLDDDAQQLFVVQVDLVDDLNSPSMRTTRSTETGTRLPPAGLTVYCNQIPSQWTSAGELLQPVRFVGVSLRGDLESADRARDTPPLCLFAGRPEWMLPPNLDKIELNPALAPQWTRLGRLGWDLAWLDFVHGQNQKPISGEELESYFSLMRVVSSSDFDTLLAGGQPASPRDCMSDVEGRFGHPVRWPVRLVSGNAIAVSGRPQETLGAQRYFQIDGFVNLGNERIVYELPSRAGTKERVIFDGEFPITLVSLNTDFVPADVVAGKRTSWEIGQYAEVRGIFYRMWSYQSEMLQDKSPQARQAAPLVVALSLKATAPPVRKASSPIGWFGYALCVATLCFLGAILYFSVRKDTRRRRR